MVLIYHDAHIEVFHTPAQHKLVLIWIGTQTEDSIKGTGKKLIELIKSFGITLVLNDNLHVQGSWAGAIDWTRMYWFPEIIKAGVRHFAWVLSGDATARQTALDAMPRYATIKSFATRHEADHWLEQQSQRKLSDVYRRTQTRSLRASRKERCLLTLSEVIAGEHIVEEMLEKLKQENPAAVHVFRQFHLTTRTEKFMMILHLLVNRYKVSSTDVLGLLTAYFSSGDITKREMNSIMRTIMRPMGEPGEGMLSKTG